MDNSTLARMIAFDLQAVNPGLDIFKVTALVEASLAAANRCQQAIDFVGKAAIYEWRCGSENSDCYTDYDIAVMLMEKYYS